MKRRDLIIGCIIGFAGCAESANKPRSTESPVNQPTPQSSNATTSRSPTATAIDTTVDNPLEYRSHKIGGEYILSGGLSSATNYTAKLFTGEPQTDAIDRSKLNSTHEELLDRAASGDRVLLVVETQLASAADTYSLYGVGKASEDSIRVYTRYTSNPGPSTEGRVSILALVHTEGFTPNSATVVYDGYPYGDRDAETITYTVESDAE
jgi:hypothetical protein